MKINLVPHYRKYLVGFITLYNPIRGIRDDKVENYTTRHVKFIYTDMVMCPFKNWEYFVREFDFSIAKNLNKSSLDKYYFATIENNNNKKHCLKAVIDKFTKQYITNEIKEYENKSYFL